MNSELHLGLHSQFWASQSYVVRLHLQTKQEVGLRGLHLLHPSSAKFFILKFQKPDAGFSGLEARGRHFESSGPICLSGRGS